MSIKRYFPRYKKLTKFRPPLWFERRFKFLNLFRQKWSRVIKGFFKRKFQFFHQDVVSTILNRKYYGRKSKRFKKIFKFNLRDKQRLQLFYSNDRLRHFQLKALARKSIKIANNRKLVKPTVFLSLLENRLFNLLYRLGYVRSLEQGKSIVMNGHFKFYDKEIKNYNYILDKTSFIQLDPKIIFLVNYYYLKYSHSFFFYKRKWLVNKKIVKKQKSFEKSNVQNITRVDILSFRFLLLKAKNRLNHLEKKNDLLKKKKKKKAQK